MFFKVPSDMLDDEVGLHASFLKIACSDIERYKEKFTDISKMTDDMKTVCRRQRPQIEVLLAHDIF